ncbi:MAG: hypothetical protein AAF518_07710 [Spirochaetota bacterium]
MNLTKTYNLRLITPLFTLSMTIDKQTGAKRKIFLYPGSTYAIRDIQTKPKKKKERKCQLLEIIPSNSTNQLAKIRYLDSNRVGKIRIENLDYPYSQQHSKRKS